MMLRFIGIILVSVAMYKSVGVDPEDVSKIDFCSELQCKDNPDVNVCGLREEGIGYRIRMFENECELLKYGCEVEDDKAYGIVNLKYCTRTFSNGELKAGTKIDTIDESEPCIEYDCPYPSNAKPVCGVSQLGNGFKVRMFLDECQLLKFNCLYITNFTVTDYHICNGVEITNDVQTRSIKARRKPNIIIVDGNMLNMENNINETIDNFFAATHISDLPLVEMNRHVNESARRMLINIFGPQVIFRPSVIIPKNISEDYYHLPTLESCFHRCPSECPDTYAPVCGQPGIVAREPTLMFQNHCYMDAAQCKMRWEDKSPTAISSAYVETQFVFCVGEGLNALYRFLPLIRTLQHMGRIKKKGYFRYRFTNFKFLNNRLLRQPNLMGK